MFVFFFFNKFFSSSTRPKKKTVFFGVVVSTQALLLIDVRRAGERERRPLEGSHSLPAEELPMVLFDGSFCPRDTCARGNSRAAAARLAWVCGCVGSVGASMGWLGVCVGAWLNELVGVYVQGLVGACVQRLVGGWVGGLVGWWMSGRVDPLVGEWVRG